ncbi:hypothetical protein MNB_SV-9-1224 [hydrothermal vent metagenome]|uniref:Outer membrane porin, OprD family n=1 Tax=hydrothermal vent metagenome TaxID=652676 RepID=A0A1W1CCC0_9ZZZZ
MKKKIVLSLLLSNILFAEEAENKIDSVRQVVGGFNPVQHTNFQIRAGYISLNQSSEIDNSSFAIGGHIDLDTKRWNGIKLYASFYTVQGLDTQNDNISKVNPDFFDKNLESFSLIPEIYIDATYSKSTIKLGRQLLDSPHADSDDIRMIPNYFQAYRIKSNEIDDLTIHAGLIDKMAGWENGVDSSEFVKISDVLGTDKPTDGIYFLGGIYEGLKDISLSAWYYNYDDIADIFYGEVGYSYDINENIKLSMGLQYDTSTASGEELLGKQDSNTFGVSTNIKFSDIGLTAMLAYNYEDDESGASDLSLGGGVFFTSMEDLTLDAIGTNGSSFVLGVGYNLSDNFLIGGAYGSFVADDKNIFNSSEIDLVGEYTLNEKISIILAYADIDDKTDTNEDYNQLRVILNYNF